MPDWSHLHCLNTASPRVVVAHQVDGGRERNEGKNFLQLRWDFPVLVSSADETSTNSFISVRWDRLWSLFLDFPTSFHDFRCFRLWTATILVPNFLPSLFSIYLYPQFSILVEFWRFYILSLWHVRVVVVDTDFRQLWFIYDLELIPCTLIDCFGMLEFMKMQSWTKIIEQDNEHWCCEIRVLWIVTVDL